MVGRSRDAKQAGGVGVRQRLRRGERRSFRFGGELVQDGKIAEAAEEASHPPNAEVVDLSDRTVMPGFIDTHVHLTMDASDLT